MYNEINKCTLVWQFIILFFICCSYMFQHQCVIPRELSLVAC